MQRAGALETLQSTIERFGADLLAREVIQPQSRHWEVPSLCPDARRFLAHVRALGLTTRVVSDVEGQTSRRPSSTIANVSSTTQYN
jgi:hypothetical protein